MIRGLERIRHSRTTPGRALGSAPPRQTYGMPFVVPQKVAGSAAGRPALAEWISKLPITIDGVKEARRTGVAQLTFAVEPVAFDVDVVSVDSR